MDFFCSLFRIERFVILNLIIHLKLSLTDNYTFFVILMGSSILKTLKTNRIYQKLRSQCTRLGRRHHVVVVASVVRVRMESFAQVRGSSGSRVTRTRPPSRLQVVPGVLHLLRPAGQDVVGNHAPERVGHDGDLELKKKHFLSQIFLIFFIINRSVF